MAGRIWSSKIQLNTQKVIEPATFRLVVKSYILFVTHSLALPHTPFSRNSQDKLLVETRAAIAKLDTNLTRFTDTWLLIKKKVKLYPFKRPWRYIGLRC
jgi:hypothetical protein